MLTVTRARLPAGLGNVFLPTGPLGICNVICGPRTVIHFKLSLDRWNSKSGLQWPWQDQTQ